MAILRIKGVDTTTGQEKIAASLDSIGLSINVGSGITPSGENGDIVAGDGTRTFSYDASAGSLTLGQDSAQTSSVISAFGAGVTETTTLTIRSVGSLLTVNTAAANTGAWMSMGGTITGTSGFTHFASIGGVKANGTASNNAGHLVFATRPASTALTPRWRITDAGHFIGEADNTYDFGASGATRPRTGYFGTALNIGNGITPSTSNGDIVAGDGTRSMTYTAATNRFVMSDGTEAIVLEPGGAVPLFISTGVTGATTANMATFRMANDSGAGVAGMINRLQFQNETSTSVFTTFATIDCTTRTPTNGAVDAQLDFLVARANVAATQMTIGNSQSAAGAVRVEIPSGLMVGPPASITAAETGDIVAGDGTNEFLWDASTGDIVAGDGTNSLSWDTSASTLTNLGAIAGSLRMVIRNTSAATTATAYYTATNDDVESTHFGTTSSSYTPVSPFMLADASFITTSANIDGGLFLNAAATDAPISFYTNNTLQWRILGGTSGGAFVGDVEAGAAVIRGADATTAATAGATLTIRGGDATTTGAGGFVNLVGGTSPTGTPGTVQVNGLPLPTVLSSTTGVNLDTVSTDTLYTVPTGRSAVVTAVIIRLTTATAPGGDAIVSVGTNASTFDNIISATTLTGLNLTTETFTIHTGGITHIGAAAEVITFQIDTADTGTTVTATVDLVGYLY